MKCSTTLSLGLLAVCFRSNEAAHGTGAQDVVSQQKSISLFLNLHSLVTVSSEF